MKDELQIKYVYISSILREIKEFFETCLKKPNLSETCEDMRNHYRENRCQIYMALIIIRCYYKNQ